MKNKGASNENQWSLTGDTTKADRYKIISVRGADLLYDTLTNTYYKQFRLPFKECGDAKHTPE